jgi:hypothetical protein
MSRGLAVAPRAKCVTDRPIGFKTIFVLSAHLAALLATNVASTLRAAAKVPQRTGRGVRLQIVEEVARFMPVRFGRFLDRHDLRHPPGTRFGTMTEGNFPQHHQRPQLLFRQIVGGRNTRVINKHQPFVVVALKTGLQSQRLFTCVSAQLSRRDNSSRSQAASVVRPSGDNSLAWRRRWNSQPRLTHCFTSSKKR